MNSHFNYSANLLVDAAARSSSDAFYNVFWAWSRFWILAAWYFRGSRIMDCVPSCWKCDVLGGGRIFYSGSFRNCDGALWLALILGRYWLGFLDLWCLRVGSGAARRWRAYSATLSIGSHQRHQRHCSESTCHCIHSKTDGRSND